MTQRRCACLAAALLVLAPVVAGCTRTDVLNRRLAAIGDPAARAIVRDALWAAGSKYRWAEHTALRADVTRTVHRPLGDSTTEEVWLVDLWGGRFRVEVPAERRVAAYDGASWHVFAEGRVTANLEARAAAAGDARLLTTLLPMPLSLTAPGQEVSYAGIRTGPGEARAWQRLSITQAPASGYGADDEAVVEVRQDTHRVEAVLIRWPELPFAGRPMRVEMDDWRPADGLLLSRRWRFFPIDDRGDPTGPALYTVRVKRIEFDPPMGPATFTQPRDGQ
ncbi:MAG: hypothetical protein IMZ66_03900 [Planctomycetes bacterium]|nr:hypothetical protein [Planctomycetota bacterium]